MRIDRLTPEQKDLLPRYRDEWTAIGLSTAPADRPRAEAGVRMAYQIAGLNSPRVVWCTSPLSQGLTRAIVLSSGASVGASVWDSVRDSVWDSVRDSVRASVGASVWASVRDSVWDSVRDSVGASVGDSVGDSVGASVGASVRDSVRDSVGASVWDSVRDSVRDSVGASGYGQHDAAWLAFYRFFYDLGLTRQTQKLEALWEITKSAGWYLPHARLCWISERHSILQRDSRGRLHCENGLACGYPDGWGVYAWHGVRVPARIILEPQSITVEEIETEQNAEIRRVMIERFGYERFILEGGAKLIHSDETGALYRKELPDDEPLVMVHVINSTPEPDGTNKKYMLRVPSDMTQARQAVAWTFGMQAEEYKPVVET